MNSPCGSALFHPAGNPCQEILSQFHTRPHSTNCGDSEDWPRWTNCSSPTVSHENSAFTHLESLINICIPSYLLNFCEIMIPCLLKSRHRFKRNHFDLTNFFKRCASYQAICPNRKTCVLFISLLTCKWHDFMSVPFII